MRGPGHFPLLHLLIGSLWVVFMLLAATALFFLIRFAVLSALKGHTVWLENQRRIGAVGRAPVSPSAAPTAPAAPAAPAAPPVPPTPDGSVPPAQG